MSISLESDFETYWRHRPKTLRKNLSRYRNRLERELGETRFDVIRAPGAVVAAVDRYGLLESEGWKGANRTALHPGNPQGEFYRALLGQYAETGDATVFELYHQDRLVASRLAIHNSRMLVILKTTFSEEYKRYAVGRMLLYRVIEYLFLEGKIMQIAFYTNATNDQLQWASESRPIYNVSFYRHPCVGATYRRLRQLGGR